MIALIKTGTNKVVFLAIRGQNQPSRHISSPKSSLRRRYHCQSAVQNASHSYGDWQGIESVGEPFRQGAAKKCVSLLLGCSSSDDPILPQASGILPIKTLTSQRQEPILVRVRHITVRVRRILSCLKRLDSSRTE